MGPLVRLAALVVLVLLAAPASASALTATNARIASHPGFVRVRITQAASRIVIRLEGARRAFKYLRVSGLHGPERLVLDLYTARPPSRAAEIRTARGGCLTLTSVTADGRGFRVRGVERELFEGSFVLRVRDAAGRSVGRRIMTARGAWSARVSYRVSTAQTGTVEAVAQSAKDGSLACLVQVRGGLNP